MIDEYLSSFYMDKLTIVALDNRHYSKRTHNRGEHTIDTLVVMILSYMHKSIIHEDMNWPYPRQM